jgi:hypothetical protein
LFFNVSAHLDRLATIQPAEEWNIYDVTHSIKYRTEFEVVQTNPHLMGWGDNPEISLGPVKFDGYRRGVGLPVDLSQSRLNDLSPGQLTLLLAMMTSGSS